MWPEKPQRPLLPPVLEDDGISGVLTGAAINEGWIRGPTLGCQGLFVLSSVLRGAAEIQQKETDPVSRVTQGSDSPDPTILLLQGLKFQTFSAAKTVMSEPATNRASKSAVTSPRKWRLSLWGKRRKS